MKFFLIQVECFSTHWLAFQFYFDASNFNEVFLNYIKVLLHMVFFSSTDVLLNSTACFSTNWSASQFRCGASLYHWGALEYRFRASNFLWALSLNEVLLKSVQVLLKRLRCFSIPFWWFSFPLRGFSIPLWCFYVPLSCYSALLCYSQFQWGASQFLCGVLCQFEELLISVELFFSAFEFILSSNQNFLYSRGALLNALMYFLQFRFGASNSIELLLISIEVLFTSMVMILSSNDVIFDYTECFSTNLGASPLRCGASHFHSGVFSSFVSILSSNEIFLNTTGVLLKTLRFFSIPFWCF